MTSNTLFYMIFLCQIYTLSVYIPGRIIQRIDYVLKNYPESTHPKLYPKSMCHSERLRNALNRFHQFMILFGIAIIAWLSWGRPDPSAEISMWWAWCFFMLQTLPSMVLEIYGFKSSKLLKAKDQRTSKKATLKRRHLFDFVSPWLVFITIGVFISFIVFSVWLYQDQFAFGSKSMSLTLVLLIANLLFALIILWNVYGKKLDPFQSDEDRHRLVSSAIRSLLYQSIMVTVFMALIGIIDVYELKSSLAILMSLFLQTVGLLSSIYILNQLPIEEVNFDVYLADTPSTQNNGQAI